MTDTNFFEQQREYIEFKAHVKKNSFETWTPNIKRWRYYQYGDKNLDPLILLHDFCGTSESFFQQILNLSARGFHIIAIDLAPCFSHDEFVIAFRQLVDFHLILNDRPFHLMGAGLGGFLAQCYAEKHPESIASLILCNSFVSNEEFSAAAILSDFYQLLPNFVLRTKMEGLFSRLATEGEKYIMLSNEYMVDSMYRLTWQENASRLKLLCLEKKINRKNFESDVPDENITIIETMDNKIYPNSMREKLYSTYPNAKRALLRDGGTFPYLSRPEDFNIYLTVHLRNVAKQNQPRYDIQVNDSNDNI
jgi:maspardin